MNRWVVPLGLLAALALVASLELPLERLAWAGSWLMVVAAIALVWAIRQRVLTQRRKGRKAGGFNAKVQRRKGHKEV